MRGNDAGLETLARGECLGLIRRVPIGRVVTTMQALPVALPVNFAVDGDSIVFRSGAGTKLFAAVHNAVVGFEVDEFNAQGRDGWSVLVIGPARHVTDEDEIARLEQLDLEPWTRRPLPHFVRIEMAQVTGRRIAVGSADGRAP